MITARYIDTKIKSEVLTDGELLELQSFLVKYNRDNCPNDYYIAWKILILGTNEYNKDKEIILKSAYTKYEGYITANV